MLSRTGGVAPIINEDGTPYGLMTGQSLFNFLNNGRRPNPRLHDMQIGEILDQPCRQAADTSVSQFQANTRIRDVLNRLLREEGDEFLGCG